MNRPIRTLLSLCAVCVATLLSTGCAQHKPPAQQASLADFRAIWVTRFDYNKPDDIRRIVKNCADGGFNAILFQVRGNGTAFYKSNIEPWAVELGGKDPGFDPLTIACEEAHKRNVQLHAWVNVMPAWRGIKPPENPEQLYNKHPEWFWYDQEGKRQALSSFYVSLNPCLPEVRKYIVDVFRDIVTRYPIDGLHLDYSRFPNEPPAIPAKSGIDYPRDARTLSLYAAATGKKPDDDKDAWNQWRTDQVSQLVSEIRAMMRQEKPGMMLTSAVGAVRKNALTHFQDGLRWLNDDFVDAVVLMNYVNERRDYAERIDPWLMGKKRGVVVPGLYSREMPGKSTTDAAEISKLQLTDSISKTGTVCIFAYASLFDSADDSELAKQDEKGAKMREIRRKVLLPMPQPVRQ